MRSFTSRTWEFLGSYPLAIVLIAVLAAVLCSATFYESANSTPAVLAKFYHTGWFALLLMMMGVNLTVSALRRWPWQQRHVGFLITHLAINLLLMGALITVFAGVDGTMSIAEGQKSDEIALDRTVVKVDGKSSQAARPGMSIALDGAATARVEEIIDSAQPGLEVRGDGKQENPAIHYTIGNGSSSNEGWLLARQAGMASQSLGPLRLGLVEAERLPLGESKPHLVIGLEGHTVDIPLPAADQRVPIEGTSWSVRVERTYARASVDGKGLVERESGSENPAVALELIHGAKTERHVCFARFPEYPTLVAGKGAPFSGATVRYETGLEAAASGPTITYTRLPDHTLHVTMQGRTEKVDLGKPISLPWMGMQITVDQVVERAQVARGWKPAPDGSPAVRITAGDETAWIGFNGQTEIKGHQVSFGPDTRKLAITIGLDKFELKTNPGTRTPASYASQVTVTDGARTFPYRISMNEPLEYGGFTFYQSGYVPGEQAPDATILRVARDPGILFKYAGTLLLVFGIFWLFYVEPALARRRAAAPVVEDSREVPVPLAQVVRTALLALSCLLVLGRAALATPQAAQDPRSPASTAEGIVGPSQLDLSAVRHLAVQANGRVRPLDTYARELVLTVTGRETFEHFDPVDLVLSWTVHPKAWSLRPVIYCPNKALKAALELDAEQSRFPLDMLLENQKLAELARQGRAREQAASTMEREAATVQDRVGLLQAVFAGSVLALVPGGTDAQTSWISLAQLDQMDPPSATRVREVFTAYLDASPKLGESAVALETAMREKGGAAYPSSRTLDLELAYNRFRPFRTSWEMFLAALVLYGLGAFWRSLRVPALALGVGGFLVNGAGIVMRVAISGRPPVTNMYESILWVAWGCAGFGLVLAWKHRQASVAVAAGVMSTLLLVLTDALPSALDPSIQPLMPVLRSTFWLTVHVLTITLGYAAFALATALGHAWLILDRVRSSEEKLTSISKFLTATLRAGILLLAAGTLLGGVWAQYSWGRFWGWDPKEVWALIALLGYLGLMHAVYAGWIGSRGVAVGSVLGFAGVLMAWYGVNYILGKGLHSYGFGSGSKEWAVGFICVELIFLALTARPGGKPRAVATSATD